MAGVSPTDSHSKGDPRGRKARIRKANYESNFWSLRIRVCGKDESAERIHWFSDGILRLLNQVSTDFVQRLSERDPDSCAIIWVGLFDIQDQGAFDIRSDASRMLGERDLELVFDMYVDHSDEQV